MAAIADSLQKVLDLAPYFSRTATQEMRERDALIQNLKANLKNALIPFAEIPEIADLSLEVGTGGYHGNYGPVPWVRVYAPSHSPKATEGIYLAYLFAADGSKVYLSLNQGSSDSSGREPLSDQQLLLDLAVEGRSALGDLIESPVAARATTSMDLAWARAPIVRHRRRRIRNYEDVNILALEYRTGQIPDDNVLLDDLGDMLPLLACLYGVVSDPAADTLPLSSNPDDYGRISRVAISVRQGRQIDAVARKKIEIYAEDLATVHLEQLGWDVERVGNFHLGYDLRCRNSEGGELHVEVKGTQSQGEEVLLTPNEVRHVSRAAECHARHALFVVSEIKVLRNGRIECLKGHVHPIWAWSIADNDNALTPTGYSYRVPIDRPTNGQKQ